MGHVDNPESLTEKKDYLMTLEKDCAKERAGLSKLNDKLTQEKMRQ